MTCSGRATSKKTIKFEKPETIAALIAEPISTSNGSRVPSQEYWQHLRKVTEEHGILLIHDEVINGFGRTGKWFASEHFGIEPDLLTMAKQISSGLRADRGGRSIRQGRRRRSWASGRTRSSVASSTWGAHPVSCAVALANLEILERERLPENSAVDGRVPRGAARGAEVEAQDQSPRRAASG